MNHNSSELFDRTLHYDGTSTYSYIQLLEFLQNGNSIDNSVFIDDINNPEIIKFNKLSKTKLIQKPDLQLPDKFVKIPNKYKNLNVLNYINYAFDRMNFTDHIQERQKRLLDEYDKFVQHNYIDLLRTVIYILHQFMENSVVWGVGRGSSCSSFLLYVIGLHDIDSFVYDLDIDDFIR